MAAGGSRAAESLKGIAPEGAVAAVICGDAPATTRAPVVATIGSISSRAMASLKSPSLERLRLSA
jgi:hypothetical protein